MCVSHEHLACSACVNVRCPASLRHDQVWQDKLECWCDMCVCPRVGDMIKFGLSTRLYVFGGPEELRPEEGLSKLQRKQLAALEVSHGDSVSSLF